MTKRQKLSMLILQTVTRTVLRLTHLLPLPVICVNQYTKMMLASRSFFYSYDYDITRKFGVIDVKTSRLPLYRLVDPLVCPSLRISAKPTDYPAVFLESAPHDAFY